MNAYEAGTDEVRRDCWRETLGTKPCLPSEHCRHGGQPKHATSYFPGFSRLHSTPIMVHPQNLQNPITTYNQDIVVVLLG
ncbi:unnamed protein product [Phytophthora fragariaefolia]|uniref:Unnamed protein product n=1 Tax=Phytophthora fragariaefolia TaxID=1490495 RepID=A0A9W6X1T1_9STRA|nr:unnamed protein product [Phytophthora fragariaefolia]